MPHDVKSRVNLHIYPSPFVNESRMLKQTATLRDSGHFGSIEIAALARTDLPAEQRLDEHRLVRRIAAPAADWIPFRLARKAVSLLGWQVRVFRTWRARPLACVNSHSLSTLGVGAALKAATGARLIYDTHELETESIESRGVRRAISRLVERTLIRRADEVVVVGDAIAAWYRHRYGLRNVHVVRNYPALEGPVPERTRVFRDKFAIPDESLVFLYQGILSRGRGIPQILEAFARPELVHHHLVMMGLGPMEQAVREHAARSRNVHFHPAVPPEAVLKHTSSADIGLSLIENACLSYYYCLPNKVFEYLLAGLPIIVSRFPEMSAVVDKHGVGWKCEPTAEDLAQAIAAIDPAEYAQRRQNTLQSRHHFGWKTQESSYLRAVTDGD